ncbi:MAG: cation diffusion facilitator family transporter [Phycisphaeraceae bacterium]
MAHEHAHETEQLSDGRLIAAVAVNVLLTVAQIIGGVLSGSLALVADALHNLNDAASLGIALLARRIARKPADRRRTFGYRRAELVGALINLTTLIIVGLYLIYEAVWRFFEPQEIAGWLVVGVAGIALVVDIITAALVYAMSRGSLNVKAAFVHNVADALASVGVIVAGVLIILYQWYWVDLVATLAISGYILWHGALMMRQTIRPLMDSVPLDVNLDDLVAAMEGVERVHSAHHVHVWEIDEHHRALEAHVVLAEADVSRLEQVKRDIKQVLRERFRIGHATLEFDIGHPDEPDHPTSMIPPH